MLNFPINRLELISLRKLFTFHMCISYLEWDLLLIFRFKIRFITRKIKTFTLSISLYEICRSIRRNTNASCIKISERIRASCIVVEAMAGWWNAATWDEDKGWGRWERDGDGNISSSDARPGAESKQQIFYGLSSFFSALLRHR